MYLHEVYSKLGEMKTDYYLGKVEMKFDAHPGYDQGLEGISLGCKDIYWIGDVVDVFREEPGLKVYHKNVEGGAVVAIVIKGKT